MLQLRPGAAEERKKLKKKKKASDATSGRVSGKSVSQRQTWGNH